MSLWNEQEGALINRVYEDILSFNADQLLSKKCTAAYLSHVDPHGKHIAYQLTYCQDLPTFIEDRLSIAQTREIFRDNERKLIDDLPAGAIMQTYKKSFGEFVYAKSFKRVFKIPLCQFENYVFFLILFSEDNSIINNDFNDSLSIEKPRMCSKITAFYTALIKIKNFFLSYRKILELKGDETFPHMERVGLYSHEIAIKTWILSKQLNRHDIKKKFSPFTLEALKIAATIHDIGKLAMPDIILNKPAKLTKEEFEIIKTHSSKGMEIINTAFPQNDSTQSSLFSQEFMAIITMTKEIIHQHHERLDGSGYPNGLKGSDIGLYSKIVMVADVFDAITSKRIYKAKQSSQLAITEIVHKQCEKYDPLILEALLRAC